MNKYIVLILILIVTIACNKTDNKFLITKDNVGVLHRNTPIQKLDSIYAKDSLVNTTFEGELRYASMERIIIFEKGGKELIEITPVINSDNQKVVESVLILDSRFATEKGISLASTYKDVKDRYPDFEIEQTLKSILVTPKNENYYFTFDKSALKNNNFGLSSEITKNDIEDNAKLSRITINWNL
ncbi:hypothetical protein CGC58_00400 [Capnocytophaga stomatis]|uniref:Lipoprotein n=1 Tax=Capnocytophaga stomatis TaxID=1848904 RepID=A0A250FW66_9FLAO|nr:hypothetical protein [Capnocytophaga stomatis]ATA88328.1 hypothetical protein CGC58_00400 [Capnocytophaga stomatis]